MGGGPRRRDIDHDHGMALGAGHLLLGLGGGCDGWAAIIVPVDGHSDDGESRTTRNSRR